MNYRLHLLVMLIALSLRGMGQQLSDTPTYKIGIFAPLYLDSAFHDNQYQFGKKFPRFTLQGFDFLQGVLLASDSFPIPNCKIETFIFDSRSDSLPIPELIRNHSLDGMKLIIGSVKDENFSFLANFAKNNRIPFISSTYPNDGNQTQNPYLIILNPTLRSHCEALFSKISNQHSNDHILLVRKKGEQEDRVSGYFKNANQNEGSQPLIIKNVLLDSNFSRLKFHLDSTKKNIIIGGSFDEDFADSIATYLNSYRKKYDIMLIGMPNWESFAIFNKNTKNSLKELPVFYTSAYFNNRTDSFSNTIINAYTNQYKGKPSDFAFKGFESFYFCTRMLCLYPDSMWDHFNENDINIFTPFHIVPVKNKKNSENTDYFENKHFFFLKKKNGIITNGWQ